MLRILRFFAFAFLFLLLCAAAALAAPGDLDTSFDGDGMATVDFSDFDTGTDVLVQPDGRLVAVGSGTATNDFIAARLNLNGSLDGTFGGGDGKAAVDLGGGNDDANAVALQPDGKIVMAGGMTVGENRNFAILRLTADGSPDPSFDGDGRRIIDYGGRDEARDVLVQPDGQIVVAGSIFGDRFAVTRLNPDGSIEDGFNTRSVDFTGTDMDRAFAVGRQPDGKIVLVGIASTTTPPNTDIAVARLNADGSPDTSFDGDGRRTIDLGGSDTAQDVLVQPDGKIVVTGAGFPSPRIAVTRLNPTGTLDASFDGDGTASVDVGGSAFGSAAALQANGKIVVAGSGAGQPLLLRFQPSGSLDTTFGGGDGQQSLAPPAAVAAGLALLADGRIAVAGRSANDLLAALVEGDPPVEGGGPEDPGPGGGGGTTKALRCAGKRATIVGTGKSDRLKGTRRADVIVSLGGNDRIDGGRGNDLICAGAGNDTTKGGAGNDRLYGQNGTDKLIGDAGRDSLDGGTGKDTLAGGADKDRLTGGGGKDTCTGGAGKDRAACERRRGI